MTNWNFIIDELNPEINEFANGELSGEQLYEAAKVYGCAETRSEVRSLLRNRGVVYGRRLARKALRRRGVRV